MTSEELDIYLLALEIYHDMILKDFPEDLTKELHEFIIDLEKRWVTIDGRHVNIGGDDSSGGGVSSGGKITDKNFTQIEKFEKQAEQFYKARVNSGNKDIELISSNTGFSYDDIKAIKNHVMIEEHLFSDGTVRKFDPNIDQALAWQRLMENKFTDTDILLLNHELRELKYMKSHKCDYETAHKYATQKYDWQSVIDSIVDKDNINPELLKGGGKNDDIHKIFEIRKRICNL